MQVSEKLMDLVDKALSEFDSTDFRLSNVMRKAIRIARLRNDFDNLWWLEMEMISFENTEARQKIIKEIQAHYSSDRFKALHLHIGKAYIDERKVHKYDKGGNLEPGNATCGLAIPEIESRIKTLVEVAEEAVPPEGLNPFDLYFVEKSKTEIRAMTHFVKGDMNKILSNVGHRVHNFLSVTEKQLLYGQLNSDIFEQNRQYIETRLKEISPEAFKQLITAYRRLGEGDIESRSQALMSCRRILKSLSDNLYPASNKETVGHDGKKRKMSDEKYIVRLWQYVSDRVGSKASGKLLLSQINDVGNRIDSIYDLCCKGVHDSVSDFEVNQCVIQTFLLIGDILRVADKDSAVGIEVDDYSVEA